MTDIRLVTANARRIWNSDPETRSLYITFENFLDFWLRTHAEAERITAMRSQQPAPQYYQPMYQQQPTQDEYIPPPGYPTE